VSECDANRSVRHLNYQLSKARYHVENAFGLLKGRFQIFEKPLRCAAEDLPFALHLIASICVLHNFLIDVQDQVREGEIPMQEIEEQLQNGGDGEDGEDGEDDIDENINGERGLAEGEVTRQALLRHIRWLDELE